MTTDKEIPDMEARKNFNLMMMSNPNYFGTMTDELAPKPVMSKCCDTSYEELVDVGYHPQQEKLEAVIHVYQPAGYSSGVCGPGSREYVRFYMSFDQGATWQDMGLTSFRAYNLPAGTDGNKHLEYAVSLPVDIHGGLCFLSRLAKVRAILSWNQAPPEDQPDWQPVWGNVREVTVQIEPELLVKLPDLLDVLEFQLPDPLPKLIDFETPIPLKKVPPDPPVLMEKYQKLEVPPHRFAFKELMQLQAQPGFDVVEMEAPGYLDLVEITPDLLEWLANPGDGDTSYEELVSIGLDPNLPNTMVGVIHIKRSSGYLGGPCTDGSTEYVTFWADFDGNGVFEKCLGKAKVQVYDLDNLPPEGAYYAVRLPVDLSELYQDCHAGARVVRIRAILSWNVPISCAHPDQTPVWGNREETLIAVTPGLLEPAGKISVLGGVPVSRIDDITGLTTTDAFFADNNLPVGVGFAFGGRIVVKGVPLPGRSYKVEVSTDGITWMPLTTKLRVVDVDGHSQYHHADPVTHRFNYLPVAQNTVGLLALWDSTGDNMVWIRLQVYDGPANSLIAAPLGGPDVHRIQLDNTLPEVSITITSGPGACGKFPVGAAIAGTFVARDARLRDYRLSVAPAINDPGEAIPSPQTGTVQTAPDPGDAWSLDTTGMKPCGYIVHLAVRDKVVVNSAGLRSYRYDSAGFCLAEPNNS